MTATQQPPPTIEELLDRPVGRTGAELLRLLQARGFRTEQLAGVYLIGDNSRRLLFVIGTEGRIHSAVVYATLALLKKWNPQPLPTGYTTLPEETLPTGEGIVGITASDFPFAIGSGPTAGAAFLDLERIRGAIQAVIARQNRRPIPDPIYRYVEKPEYLTALLAGDFYLSTFETCRNGEGERRDDEGSSEWHSGRIIGTGSSLKVQVAAARMQIPIPLDAENVCFDSNVVTSQFPDAWLLCTTSAPNEICRRKFGPYCVRIDEPWTVYKSLCDRLHKLGHTKGGLMDWVAYGTRVHTGLQSSAVHAAHLKPKRFEDESEIRMVWLPRTPSWNLARFPVPCPEVAHLIKRID
jgi:hypothetical protein